MPQFKIEYRINADVPHRYHATHSRLTEHVYRISTHVWAEPTSAYYIQTPLSGAQIRQELSVFFDQHADSLRVIEWLRKPKAYVFGVVEDLEEMSVFFELVPPLPVRNALADFAPMNRSVFDPSAIRLAGPPRLSDNVLAGGLGAFSPPRKR